MHTLLLIAISVAPALAFLVLVLRMDRREPEPAALVARVVGLGAAAGVVAALVEAALDGLSLFHAPGLAGSAAESFLLIAPVEELAKVGVVLLFVWNNANFNEENDGVVYVGASAIGFAVLENIAYVVSHGIGTGILRAFTSVPLHVFTAVIMGLSVGRARFAATRAMRNRLLAAGFLCAWAAHGTYDTLALSRGALTGLILPLLAGLAAFGIMSLRKGRRLSLLRWGPGRGALDASPADTLAADAPASRGTHRWMAVVGRILLGSTAAFWALFLVGMAQRGSARDAGPAVLGAAVMTVLPAALGALFEVSYQRHRRRARSHRSFSPSLPSPPGS
jgi:protease PrsW